jgi:hypothetical protein
LTIIIASDYNFRASYRLLSFSKSASNVLSTAVANNKKGGSHGRWWWYLEAREWQAPRACHFCFTTPTSEHSFHKGGDLSFPRWSFFFHLTITFEPQRQEFASCANCSQW